MNLALKYKLARRTEFSPSRGSPELAKGDCTVGKLDIYIEFGTKCRATKTSLRRGFNA